MIIRRGKGRLNADKGIKDMYKYYCEKSKNPVVFSVYKKICEEVNQAVADKMVTENFVFVPPARIGNLSVKKFKRKLREKTTPSGDKILNLPVDWQATRMLWKEHPELKGKKVVYHTNEHTDGYEFKFVWNNITSNMKNKYFMKFKCMRKLSRRLKDEIKSNPDFDAYEL